MGIIRFVLIGSVVCSAAAFGEVALVLRANMDELRCEMPNETYRFVGSNAPGQIFLPDEPANIRLVLKKGTDEGPVDFSIEIQEIGTRTPGRVVQGMEGFTDTAGHAPLIDLIGKPASHPLKVAFDDAPEKAVEVQGLPLPKRFGTYALVLVRDNKRHFLATVCRVPVPRPNGNVENVPVFGEGSLIDRSPALRAQQYYRMGVRGWRSELSWSESADGKYDFSRYDELFAGAEAAGMGIMVTLGGHPQWAWPFSPMQTPGAVGPNWDGNPYWGQADWLCDPKLYPRYGAWIKTFCERYWKGGKGALWGIENYNEPWEGGGISGWARDCIEYRSIQKLISGAARTVDTKIKLLAASSIMNTEDKFYSDGSGEFDSHVDIFTDHYVVPCMAYGPMVASAHGKESMETETWFVNTECLLPQGVAQFMAAGQKRIAPWHPRVLFDRFPGTDDNYFIPTPVVAATAAFNYFVTGKEFEKIVFRDHLPWVFQFGKDSDVNALLVVFGQLMTIGGAGPRERLWAQVDGAAGGTMTIDNADGLLSFYDLAGNPLYAGEKSVSLPMTIFPTYVTCAKGPAAAAVRIKAAKIEGKRPVEILPRDFDRPLSAAGLALEVGLHNCLNRTISGSLMVAAPETITLKEIQQNIELGPGQTKELTFPATAAKPPAANSFPFRFRFTSDAGDAEYAEDLSVAIAVKRSIKVDGNLDDWKDIPGVMVIAKAEKVDSAELLRRPWLEVKEKQPDGTFGEVKLAWDGKFLYVAALVNDPTDEKAPIRMEGRDENSYFHTKADDELPQFKKFLEKFPNRSMAEAPYVYARSPEAGIPFRRDRLQIALDVTADWHDLKPTTDRLPCGFHAVPDTDYEYSLYLCKDGKSELWRQLAPGVPRIHDFPRQPRGQLTTGPVPKADHVVRRDGKAYIYEMAIPQTELSKLKLEPGTAFGFVYKIGNSDGPSVEYGHDKAVTKINGLTLHPYWERSPSAGVRWTLVGELPSGK